MEEPLDRAREILDRRTAIGMLATTAPDGRPDVCLLIAARFVAEDRIAGGEEQDVSGETFRNLRQNPMATIVAVDPIMDPRARDGVRVSCRFLGAEVDGEELDLLSSWLENYAPGRKVIRRLIFKVLDVQRYRPPRPGPALIP